MDTDEISRLVRELKLTKEAQSLAVSITPEEEKRGERWAEKRVVGKIFSRRLVNKETLGNNLPKIIRARGRIEIEWVGHNLFVASFSLAADKEVALHDGPWHHFQDLMLLKETKMMQTPADVVFDEITMWVQCHNVPLACMEAGLVRRIGEKVGKVVDVDEGEEGWCVGKIARVRVTRKIDEPLIRCVPIMHNQTTTEVLVILQYEKLPQFCFHCGIIGHITKDCESKHETQDGPTYDNWLRAGRSMGGWVPRVSGYEDRSEGSSSKGIGSELKETRVLVVAGKEDQGKETILKEKAKEVEKCPDETGMVVEEEGESSFMEVMVSDCEPESRARINKGGEGKQIRGESGGIETDAGGLMEGNETVELCEKRLKGSPGKKRQKRVGKNWKRRARESLSTQGTKSQESEVSRRGPGSRKRGGREIDSDAPTSKAKSGRVSYDQDASMDITAVAAEQHRRSL